MLIDTGISFHEFVTKEPLLRGTIQQAVVDFLEGREPYAALWL
jgi:hypothetical protein